MLETPPLDQGHEMTDYRCGEQSESDTHRHQQYTNLDSQDNQNVHFDIIPRSSSRDPAEVSIQPICDERDRNQRSHSTAYDVQPFHSDDSAAGKAQVNG